MAAVTMKPAISETLPVSTIDWTSLIPLIGEANRGLSDYNGMLRHLPNAQMLLAPLTVQEAVLSSRIEGTLATMSEVLRFEAGETPVREARRQDIEETLNYRKAMEFAVASLERKPFHLNLLLALHRILLDSVRGQNKAPGHFRRIQNYIGERMGGSSPFASLLPNHSCFHKLSTTGRSTTMPKRKTLLCNWRWSMLSLSFCILF